MLLIINTLFCGNFQFIEAFCGPYCDLASVISIKNFFNSIGCSNIGYYPLSQVNCVDFRSMFLLNSTLFEIENFSIVVLIGSNLRLELPLLNSRLRKN